jgi:5-formyltetrahydrofolate cyclo-ligase
MKGNITSDAIQQAKAALRARISAELKKMTAAERAAASLQACARLEQQDVWKNARAILFYAPLPEELDIWRLVQDSLAAGKMVALPRFSPEEQAYEACQITQIERDLAAGKFGVREPREHCGKIALNRLDLILVPGLAFDMDGRRLGWGKGYYDRLLADLNGPACGVAFDQQMVEHVPSEPHDIRLSYIVTPTRWLNASGPRAVLK